LGHVIAPTWPLAVERWECATLARRDPTEPAAWEAWEAGCGRFATVFGWGPLGGVRRVAAAEAVEFSRELTVAEDCACAFGAGGCVRVAVPAVRVGVVADAETWVLVPTLAVAWAPAVGVETLVLTATEPLELGCVLTVADTVGVDVVVDAWGALGVTVALVCADAGGVEAWVDVETDGVEVCAEALVEADAAGVETLALALAEGVDDGWTVTCADAETCGGGGVPGRPSALAGTA
jgi:hypothetical protein